MVEREENHCDMSKLSKMRDVTKTFWSSTPTGFLTRERRSLFSRVSESSIVRTLRCARGCLGADCGALRAHRRAHKLLETLKTMPARRNRYGTDMRQYLLHKPEATITAWMGVASWLNPKRLLGAALATWSHHLESLAAFFATSLGVGGARSANPLRRPRRHRD